MAWKKVKGSFDAYEYNEKTHEVRNAKTHVKVGERTHKNGSRFYRLSINGKKRNASWATIVKGIPEFNVNGNNERVCAKCGKKFNAHNSRSRFCSKRCKKNFENKEYFHIKRCKKRGLAYEHGVNLPALIERDHGICQICGKQTSKENLKDSPTIDHIIPIEKGGTHTWDNVQLACLSCNSRKGSKIYIENHGDVVICV